MKVEEKFGIRRQKKIEVNYFVSVNLAPESNWSNEGERVKITIQPYAEDKEDERRLHLVMSRRESLELGNKLVQYGQAEIKD